MAEWRERILPDAQQSAQGEFDHRTGREIRRLCREGALDRPTAGVARGFAQANLVILSREYAADFEEFCRLNPQPCPLLEVASPGSWEPMQTAPGADVRTDLPRYRIYRYGRLTERTTSILHAWTQYEGRDGLTCFLIGCSFTFERALLRAGIPVRHLEEGCNVPMFRTNVFCRTAGPFAGPMVVSMRPMTPEQAETARTITAAMPRSHGAPIHVGDPAILGIDDLSRPTYGDAVTVRPGEIPVFWACGVTPIEAILRAAPPFAVTHEPGHMLVTDLRDGHCCPENQRDENNAPWSNAF
jgi:uncharacterized protein YcsI (UPF0317 family)